ncbi:MAG: glycosyl transferase, partial [Acidobacteria bacterium]
MAPSADTLGNLRVALVHHWLVRMRGGEKVLKALCQIFPQADIYTLVFDPNQISESIRQHQITTSWIQKL